jgi:hypothetical protein
MYYKVSDLEVPVFFLEVGPFPSYYACGGDQRQAPSAGRLLQFLSIVGRQGLLTLTRINLRPSDMFCRIIAVVQTPPCNRVPD